MRARVGHGDSPEPGWGSGDSIVIAASDWAKLFCMFELRVTNQRRRQGSDLRSKSVRTAAARGKACARPERAEVADLLGKRPKDGS